MCKQVKYINTSLQDAEYNNASREGGIHATQNEKGTEKYIGGPHREHHST